MQSPKADSLEKLTVTAAVAATIAMVVVFAVLNGTFYDDEIFSIRLLGSLDIAGVIDKANSGDIHPPGSYVLMAILRDALGSWRAVKFADGLVNAFGLAGFVWFAYGRLGRWEARLLAFLMATAASYVLWGASLRWYAFFNLLFAVALGVLLFADISRTARTVVLGLSAVLLFHINYEAFCAVPVLLAAHIAREFRNWTARDFAVLAATGALGLVLCIPQLIVFFRVHLPDHTTQAGPPLHAFVRTAMTLGFGNAVFPIGVLPAFYAVCVAFVLGSYGLARRNLTRHLPLLTALVTGIVFMSLTGLGSNPRNAVYLLPLVAVLLASALVGLPRKFGLAAFGILALYQAQGLWNVVAHARTIKGSYNTDYAAAVNQIVDWNRRCNARLVVLNHDTVLTYLLENNGIAQSSPWKDSDKQRVDIVRGNCLVLVRTYHGNFPDALVRGLYARLDMAALRQIATRDIGSDPDYAVKSWISGDSFAPYYVRLALFEATRDTSLLAWSEGEGGERD